MKKNELRELEVLKHLVEEYVATGEEVSSRVLCEKYLQNVSSATVRIDLFKLENRNLIYQPHTSAGRCPTIAGIRQYLDLISEELESQEYARTDFLREMLVSNYKDTPLSLHYVMQFLAKETDQLSFVAEPEISYGYLQKFDVFKIGDNKLLFVVSLDSGLDKTVILKTDFDISDHQLKALVRYLNDELVGMRIFDIQHKYLEQLTEKFSDANKLVSLFLEEFHNALLEINNYFIHFDGNIKFLEQPEFDSKSTILTFLDLMQKHDMITNLMQKNVTDKSYSYILGEDFGNPLWANYCLVYSKYEIFDVPGYLGILAPLRMDYRKNIPIIRDIARTITNTTKKGMMVKAK